MNNLEPTAVPLPANLATLRLNLEAQIASLNAALRHGQRWEAEYEGYGEEIRRLEERTEGDEQTTRADMLRIGLELESDLLTEKEILELVGPEGSASSKSVNAVCGRIARRVEYVQQNIKTLQKQLDVAEIKLEKLLVVTAPEATDEQGLPLMEIHEELDDDENVISGTVTQAQNRAPVVVEALKKAGIVDGDLADASTAIDKDSKDVSAPVDVPTTNQPALKTSESSASQDTTTTQTKPTSKKSVSFAADTKDSNDTPPSIVKPSLEEITKGSFNQGDRVLELDDFDRVINSTAVIPPNESPEDAALRREMLEYQMNEVGSIVAQLDLDERGSITSDLDEDFDEDMGSASSIEDEDEHGLNRGVRLNDAYRAEMLALEQKLNASILQNLGPNPALPESMDVDDPSTSTPTETSPAPLKDITEKPPSTTQPAPLKDVTEKLPSTTQPPLPTPRKPSRFKQERAPPTQEPARVLSDVVERTPTTTSPRTSIDDFDPATHRQEIANEYYAQRNRLIHKQGGFVQSAQREEEEEDVPPGELFELDDQGRPKKVSLFKAARVRQLP